MTLKKYTDSDLAFVQSLLTEEETRFLLYHGIPSEIMGMYVLDQPEIIDQTNVVLYREIPEGKVGSRRYYAFIEGKSRKIFQSNDTLPDIEMFNNNLMNSSLQKMVEMTEKIESWFEEINLDSDEDIPFDNYQAFKNEFLKIESEFCQFWFNTITYYEDFTS